MKSCVFYNFHTFSFIGGKSCELFWTRQENHYCSPQLSAEAERNEQADCRIQRRQERPRNLYWLHRQDLEALHRQFRSVRYHRQKARLQEIIWEQNISLPRKSWRCSGSIGFMEHTQLLQRKLDAARPLFPSMCK